MLSSRDHLQEGKVGENNFWPWITSCLGKKIKLLVAFKYACLNNSFPHKLHLFNNPHGLTKCSKIWKLKPERVVCVDGSVMTFRLTPKGTKWTLLIQMISPWVVIVPESPLYYHIATNLSPPSPHSIHPSCYIGLYHWFKWPPIGLNILNIQSPSPPVLSSPVKLSTFFIFIKSWIKGSACSSPQICCHISMPALQLFPLRHFLPPSLTSS